MAGGIILAIVLAVVSILGGIIAYSARRYGLMLINLAPLILMIIVIIAGSFMMYRTPPAGGMMKEEVIIRIPKGAPFAKISKILKENSLIHNEYGFLLAARFLKVENSIHAGRFRVKTGLNCIELARYLSQAAPINEKVTIIEGITSPEIADELIKVFPISRDSFLAIVNDSASTKKYGLDTPLLEGQLFPDTYLFPETVSEREIISAMVSQFKKVMTGSIRAQIADSLKMTLWEVVTLASIIQGEAQAIEEMPRISSVYHNRLKRRIPLQADPTIQFIIPDGPRRLLYKDLKIDSPYNTYKYRGLPPGPINNPGKDALLAAVYPEDTDYLYFVAKGDGTHVFSRTQAEHLKAKREFNKVRREVSRQKREVSRLQKQNN